MDSPTGSSELDADASSSRLPESVSYGLEETSMKDLKEKIKTF